MAPAPPCKDSLMIATPMLRRKRRSTMDLRAAAMMNMETKMRKARMKERQIMATMAKRKVMKKSGLLRKLYRQLSLVIGSSSPLRSSAKSTTMSKLNPS